MSFKLKPGIGQRLRTHMVIIAAIGTSVGVLLFALFFGYFNTGIRQEAKATTLENIAAGSFIINMGIVPQTKSNALLPYGMIYEMNSTYNVPVKWVISTTKVKDGADFTHNGVTYKGGTFIIPAAYITPAVSGRIEYWKSLGVVGNYSVASINVPVYSDITSYPRVMIDNLSGNDSIITKYFANASIPATSYEINSPVNLNSCHDIWINPHGDPTWATHNYLYNFVTVQKSFIWMQCHAVSMMEYCSNPVAPFTKLNYLTTNGLQCYMSGKCGTNPQNHVKALPGAVTLFYPTDPVMQFMGTVTQIASSGSEKWYVPLTTGGWRSTTKRLATTGGFASPGEGVILTYGPAFGDSTNGLVMYTGGHDIQDASTADAIAGQRSFLNFMLLAGKQKAPALQASVTGNMNANAIDTFSVTVTGGIAPYTYSWSSNVGGTFSNPNAAITQYASFHTEIPTPTIITCIVTDACGRRNFFNQLLLINASPLPISLMAFSAKVENKESVSLEWITATEINNNYFTIARSGDGKTFAPWQKIPSKGNSNSIKTYKLSDTKPLPGLSFYQLSQTDFDGTTTALKIVKVEIQNNGSSRNHIRVTPNPFDKELVVRLGSDFQGKGIVKIWNLSGKQVYEEIINIEGDEIPVLVNMKKELTQGQYLLRVFNGDQVSDVIKIIKK